MKNLLALLLFVSMQVTAQTYSVKGNSGSDQTNVLQQAFNTPGVNTVMITNGSVLINGTVNIPEGKVLKFEGGSLTGKGAVNGGILEANYHQQIFDIALTVNPRAVNQYFSAKWFGAAGNLASDDYNAIQKSINTCIRNNIRTVYLPVGRYRITQPLILRGDADDAHRTFCTLEILGESSFWDSNVGSEITADFTNTFAIGIQDGKGCKIRKLKLIGKFVPPFTSDQHRFYNTSFDNFVDGVCRDSRYSPYSGIVIDPFTNLVNQLPSDGGYPGLTSYYGKSNGLQTQSGSTGTEIEELKIKNFVVGICSAPNGLTRNAEISIFNKIQFEDCKLCVSGGQDQEKGNVISNIYCWGACHTIFATGLYGGQRMAGNWNIDHANIAGLVVRFIYNDQHGYFATYVRNIFAESLGTWGTINSELASEISDCQVDFAFQNVAGVQTLITSYGENIVYRNCNFRYYDGAKNPLYIEGNCVFDHCYFDGPVKNKAGITNYFFPVNSTGKQKIIQVCIALFACFMALAVAVVFFRQRKKTTLILT